MNLTNFQLIYPTKLNFASLNFNNFITSNFTNFQLIYGGTNGDRTRPDRSTDCRANHYTIVPIKISYKVKSLSSYQGMNSQLNNFMNFLLYELSTSLVRPAGLEPTTFWFEAKHSIQLSYGRPRS